MTQDFNHPQPRHDGSELIADAVLLDEGRHPDPSTVLGFHKAGEQALIRAFLPHAQHVYLVDLGQTLQRIADTNLFEWQGLHSALPLHYRLTWSDAADQQRTIYDPYNFPPQLSLYDLHLFNEGRHLHAYRLLGAHLRTVDGITGALFSVWAPNAERVSVVGDCNGWDGRYHPMRRRGHVWELFIPGVTVGVRYQFEIRVSRTGGLVRKSDPYGRSFEFRPAIYSVVADSKAYSWHDEAWMARRRRQNWLAAPLSVYEIHLSSWQRDQAGHYLSYQELARRLVAYVSSLGFTHIELMPITEHPLDDSWGYQTTGYFAPTSRHGTVEDFRCFVDYCHQAGIGVILDWVPSHFPKDAHGLASFDGTYLYEYEDPTRREHRGWGTLAFDYNRNQVKNFLLASACFWLEECHLDGLRVDAVSSMLYLDYSRESGEWLPNPFGGNENLDAISFLRELNEIIHRRYPGVLMIAEESTAWPLVTRPVWMGGLGFGMKWNMGWMHDTLEYFAIEPPLRGHHQELLTFASLYAFTENFMLSLSHDEVVYGKGSLLARMPGDRAQRFANLRLLYVYMWTYPGKKSLFMGNEFGQEREWSFSRSLDWELLNQMEFQGVHALLRDLNGLYRSLSSLHACEFSQEGFEWLDCQEPAQSIVVYLRHDGSRFAVVVFNLAATARTSYRIGVPYAGLYQIVLNSDAVCYGGDSVTTRDIMTSSEPCMGQACSLLLDLPPLTALILVPY